MKTCHRNSPDTDGWKKWLAIYLTVGAVAYAVLYLALFHHGGGGGGFHY